MLKLKYLSENFELAKNCIQHWEHDPAALDETLGWFRISSNAVYPFRQKERLCFLRLAPAAEKPIADVEGEIAVIRWLRAQGFSAMEPLPMKDGRLCAVLDTPYGSYAASCFAQVEGKPLEDCPLTPELAEGYGRCLGRLHRLLQNCPHSGERADHHQLLERIARRLDAHHAPECVQQEYRQVSVLLEALPTADDSYGLIHYDFEPDNVFYSDGAGQFAVIDFDDMLRCWRGVDVVRAVDGLTEMAGDRGDSRPAAFWHGLFLQGYRSESTFAAREEAALPLMRRLVRLEEYAGLLEVLAEEVPEPPAWMVQLVQRLREKLGLLEGLMAGE